MWRETTITALVVLLLFSLFCMYRRPRVKVEEMFCPCGVDFEKENFHNQGDARANCPCGCSCSGFCNCQRCPYKKRYPLPTLHRWACGMPGGKPGPGVVGERSDKASCPYYKRSWPVCHPCGDSTDLSCQTQTYVAPYEDTGSCGKMPGVYEGFSPSVQKAYEGYSDFPRDTLSCEPGCATRDPYCKENPYGQNYQDPRWKNERFWRRQEWAPGLPGEPVGWYPTAPMTS